MNAERPRPNESAPVPVSVGVAGFEPTTSSSRTKRATGLRYTPMRCKFRDFLFVGKSYFQLINFVENTLQPMLNLLKYIEKFLVWGILLVVSLILLLAFVDIVYEIWQKIWAPPVMIINAEGLMDLFSIFLVLLIGLELLETVKAYLKDDLFHVEFIILVAIIAISRKVIVWDFDKYSTTELLSLSAMIVALGVTYFLIKKSDFQIKLPWSKKGKSKKD